MTTLNTAEEEKIIEQEQDFQSIVIDEIVVDEIVVDVSESNNDNVINENVINENVIVNENVINENVIVNESKNNLTIILLDSLEKNLGNISLSPTEINMLKEFLSISPSSVEDINKCILEIIKDGKIDAMDIPSFLTIVKDIYILSHKKITIKVSDLIETIGKLIKFIIQVVLVQNNLATTELIQSLNGLIDITIDMIKFNPVIKSKTCFFRFL